MKQGTELGIYLLTHFHSGHVKEIINFLGPICPEVTFYVVGNQQDHSTKIECQKHSWVNFIEVSCGFSTDDKIEFVLNNFSENYCWIIGDGLLPEITTVLNLIKNSSSDVDTFHLLDISSRDIRKYFDRLELKERIETSDVAFFFENFYWTSTFLGSLIISKSRVEAIRKEMASFKYTKTGFLFPTLLFNSLVSYRGRIEIVKLRYFLPNPKKELSMWVKDGRAFSIWLKSLKVSLDETNKELNPFKNKVYIDCNLNNNNFTLRGLLKLRSYGAFDGNKLRAYKNELEIITPFPFFLFVISKLPIPISKFALIPFKVRYLLKKKFIQFLIFRKS